MTELLNWFATNESALSGIAALIAILAGIAVVTRLVWTRMPSQVMRQVKRPAFLSDWRNIGLIGLGLVAVISVLLLTTNEPAPSETPAVARLTQITGKPSVAVLPLNSLSDDPDQAYLADGIAEDVITLLSYNPRFFVIARNSSFTYKGQSVDIRQVGEELGVRYVVEGSLRKVGDRLRVTVQLIDTSNGQHIWAKKYDRAIADMFALQDQITDGIASALGDEIFRAEITRANRGSTDNLDAWGLVMRANRSLISYNLQSSLESARLLRAALAIDPSYTLARAELSISLCLRVTNGFSDNPKRDITEAHTLGAEALREEPDDPAILVPVGSCYGYTGRTEEGIRLLEKALSQQPNNILGLMQLGTTLAFNGQAGAGLPKLEKAIQLSPRAPEMYLAVALHAAVLNELERYAEAEQAALKSIKLYGGWMRAWTILAQARAGLGDKEGAQQAIFTAKKIEPRLSLELLRASNTMLYKDKGKHAMANIEKIWPDDLLTASENKTD